VAGLASLRVSHHRTEDITVVESEHRDHDVVEQVIVDQGPGLLVDLLNGSADVFRYAHADRVLPARRL
jgi:hypothetical protein